MNERITHRKQHFLPVFALAPFCQTAEKKLLRYKFENSELICEDVFPGAAGFLKDIYSLQTPDGQIDTSLEKHFFGQLDNAAALVHKAMRNAISCAQLTEAQRECWAKFLIAQIVRVPRYMEQLTDFSTADFLKKEADSLKQSAAADERGAAARHEQAVAVLDAYEVVGRNNARQALPTLIESEKLRDAITQSHWGVLDMRKSRVKLIASDNPAILVGSLAKKDFVLTLPLGPDFLFCATGTPEALAKIRKEQKSKLAQGLNKDAVLAAKEYVFASDDQSDPLIRRHFHPCT